jgi:hypothetical protein
MSRRDTVSQQRTTGSSLAHGNGRSERWKERIVALGVSGRLACPQTHTPRRETKRRLRRLTVVMNRESLKCRVCGNPLNRVKALASSFGEPTRYRYTCGHQENWPDEALFPGTGRQVLALERFIELPSEPVAVTVSGKFDLVAGLAEV